MRDCRGRFRRGARRARRARRHDRADPLRRFLCRRRAPLRRRLGGRALRRDPRGDRGAAGQPASGDARDHRAARRSSRRADAFEGIYRLRALRAATRAGLVASIDLLCVPSIPSPVHARRRRSRSDRRQFAARHLYEFRQPARSRGDRGAGRQARRRPALRRHSDRARRRRRAPCGVAARPAHCHDRNARRDSPGRLSRAHHTPDGVPRPNRTRRVGAHLSGMPLNRQLVELGGVFARAVRTVADYRLYALGGTASEARPAAVPPQRWPRRSRRRSGRSRRKLLAALSPPCPRRFRSALSTWKTEAPSKVFSSRQRR